MLSRKALVMGLMTIFGGLGSFGSASASPSTDTSPKREQFLKMLISRQDNAILHQLTTQKQRLDVRLHRLEHEFSRCYKLELRFRATERLVRRRDELVTRLLANPPRSPTYNQLVKLQKGLELQQQRVTSRIERLSGIVPANPRQATRIDRTLTRLSNRSQRLTGLIAFIDRTVATPSSPTLAANFLARPTRGVALASLSQEEAIPGNHVATPAYRQRVPVPHHNPVIPAHRQEVMPAHRQQMTIPQHHHHG